MAELSPADEPTPTASIPGVPPDWADQASTKVLDLVDTARAKTSGPAIRISRTIVYGLVAALLALIALPLLLIGLTRGLTNLIDLGTDRDKAVWITYAGIGGVMSLAGLLLWRKRPKGAAIPSRAG